MKILIAGDHFMTPRLFEDAMRKWLEDEYVLQIATMEVDWPETPFEEGRGIKEYVGIPEEIAERAADVEVLVTHVAPIDRQVIESAKRLRVIGVARGGPVNVDVEAASARRIPVVYAPGRNARAVAEFTVGLILAEVRSIARSHADLVGGMWRSDLYRYDRVASEIGEMTVGVVGFGHVGRLVARLLRSFGARVLAYDPYISCDPEREGVDSVSLENLLQESDVVTLHARLTTETHHLIDRSALARMRRGAYLINTARGGLVDHEALEAALRTGHLSGAALDTFDPEPPPPGSSLLTLPNVTVTPHIAGASRQTADRAADRVAQEVANFLKGRPVTSCANPNALSAS